MINVLFISNWYPHRYDKMAGLFVRKHAEAVSLFCNVQVLYVHADPHIKTYEFCNEKISETLTELTVYYPGKTGSMPARLFKLIHYFTAYYKGYMTVSQGFTPDIVHANILTRTGLIAYFLKITKGIPYIITEHWSRYLTNRNSYKGVLRKMLTGIIVKRASAILPVSENLKNAMLSHGLSNDNYQVVSNVVDDFFFREQLPESRARKRMLHVSCFDEAAKNVKGIIDATYELSKRRTDFELVIVGTGNDFKTIYEYTATLDFPEGMIKFLGEKTPVEVAYWMQNSDFFVLFSNYENSPVVISESLACGKPVITTNVGGISEHINLSNGLFVMTRNETELCDNMNYMLDAFEDYNIKAMKMDAKIKFSYTNVGRKLHEIYKSIVE